MGYYGGMNSLRFPLSVSTFQALAMSLVLGLGATGVGAGEPFHPQDLDPDFFAESVLTFVNPLTNADCIVADFPNYCCSGFQRGTCDQPVSSFRVVQCTTRNADCTAAGVPNACCTGFRSGDCCYEQSDNHNGGLGSDYCPASVCPDGCVSQWVEQSGFKSQVASHPITGRTLEQDDLEKPCLKLDCIGGHPCLTGHSKWIEPQYPASQQPEQDAVLEIEPADRTGPMLRCEGPFYLAQLVKVVPQTEDHRLLAGFTKRLLDSNALQFRPFSGGTVVSVDNVFPQLDAWYLIELQRAAGNALTVWINGQNRTRFPVPTNGTLTAWSTHSFCETKTCDLPDNQEFQGDAALLFYRCGALPSAEDRRNLRDYVLRTFTGDVFQDGFETGDLAAWSRSQP